MPAATTRIENLSVRFASEWRTYCIYSGHHLPEAAITSEHVIPRALGGKGATVIPCSKAVNSRIGHEIDTKVTNDPLIIFGRRDTGMKGNSGKEPRAILERAASWKHGDAWYGEERRFKIEFLKDGQPKVYDTWTGKFLPPDIFATTGFAIPNMQIDSTARARFVAKTLLGLGWKIFGEAFLATGHTDSLRSMIGTCKESYSEQVRIYYLDPFVLKYDDPALDAFRVLQEQTIQKDRTSILMRHTDFGIEWSVSCVGYFVGSLIYPVHHRLLPERIPLNGGVRITIENQRLVFDAVDPFPAPWGP
jgi:hypothetical protein